MLETWKAFHRVSHVVLWVAEKSQKRVSPSNVQLYKNTYFLSLADKFDLLSARKMKERKIRWFLKFIFPLEFFCFQILSI